MRNRLVGPLVLACSMIFPLRVDAQAVDGFQSASTAAAVTAEPRPQRAVVAADGLHVGLDFDRALGPVSAFAPSSFVLQVGDQAIVVSAVAPGAAAMQLQLRLAAPVYAGEASVLRLHHLTAPDATADPYAQVVIDDRSTLAAPVPELQNAWPQNGQIYLLDPKLPVSGGSNPPWFDGTAGRTLWLDSLKPAQGSEVVGPVAPAGPTHAVRIQARGGPTQLVYNVTDSGPDVFAAEVALDRATDAGTGAQVALEADGVVIAQSPVLLPGAEPVRLAGEVGDAAQLALRVVPQGGGTAIVDVFDGRVYPEPGLPPRITIRIDYGGRGLTLAPNARLQLSANGQPLDAAPELVGSGLQVPLALRPHTFYRLLIPEGALRWGNTPAPPVDLEFTVESIADAAESGS